MRPSFRVLLAALHLLLAATLRAEKPEAFMFIPAKGEGPFPVAVWLHGYRGYSPDGYSAGGSSAAMQAHADKLGAVILGFPATTNLEDDTQQWSEEPVADHAYLQSRLRAAAKSGKLDLKRVGLFGFSQGAQVAAELASLYPDKYLGAILMSPGGLGEPRLAETKLPAHARQVYFCLCNALEHPGNVGLTKSSARHLDKVLGAQVTLRIVEGAKEHSRPADFMEKFPGWMASILKSRDP